MGAYEPVGHWWCGGQSWHWLVSARLVAAEKVPFGHGNGDAAPRGHMKPGRHGRQLLRASLG